MHPPKESVVKEDIIKADGIRFSVSDDGKEVGRAYLYPLKNDLHSRPFGLLEDVYVDEKYRGKGVASQLLEAVTQKAKALNCYKLIATSRNDGTRQAVHDWYLRLGFADYGTEFRINF